MIEAFEFHRDIVHLLYKPCLYCGYNGDNYWDAGSHDAECPFCRMTGFKKRRDALPYIIRRWASIVKSYREIKVRRMDVR